MAEGKPVLGPVDTTEALTLTKDRGSLPTTPKMPKITSLDPGPEYSMPDLSADDNKIADKTVKNPLDKVAAPAKSNKPVLGSKPKTPAPLNALSVNQRPVRKKPRRYWAKLTFLLFVLLPTALAAYYYVELSSDHFRSEMRFSVRGTDKSILSNFGLSALPGASSQGEDAYVVIDYIHSKQVLLDIKNDLGIDIRQFYTSTNIDPLYRIKPEMPVDEFVYYWQWMTDAGYNSTTGITTFQVTAFTPEDSKTIADAVIKVAGKLVNTLSAGARQQLIETAQDQVELTEKRLIKSRGSLAGLRNREQSLNPSMRAQAQQNLIQQLESNLLDLKARRSALEDSEIQAAIVPQFQ